MAVFIYSDYEKLKSNARDMCNTLDLDLDEKTALKAMTHFEKTARKFVVVTNDDIYRWLADQEKSNG